ncbi:MAG: thiolase family protein [Thermoplasmata archaeon]
MGAPPRRSVAILSAVRTPIGKYRGALRTIPAARLGALAASEAIGRSGLKPADIEDVLFGQAIGAGQGQNPARQVLRASHIPDDAGASTINMVCGSGMKAVHLGYSEILAGGASRVLVGGMESMSRAPFLLPPESRWEAPSAPGSPPSPVAKIDANTQDGLSDAYGEHELMGMTGERIAERLGITREEADAYSLRSHRRAVEAGRGGRLREEIVPVPPGFVPGAPGLDHDENPRPTTSLEALSKLRPAFKADGILTAGNSSSLADGGAALVLASAEEVAQRGLRPMAWIHSICVSGVDPANVMESPIPTVRKHLAETGLSPGVFSRIEHNEAFSTASIAVQRAFDFPDERFNAAGGAVALGHPIGMSGARIVVTLVHELLRTQGELGLATLCMGGGNGLSLIVDRSGLAESPT